MSLFANDMLTTTVDIVRVSHTGMKMFGKSVEVLDVPVEPLVNREVPQLSAAKPNITIVIRMSRRDEDLPVPPPS